jgi:hypothetical protein
MQLSIILANNEQNVKPYPKKAHDACFAAWKSQFGQKVSISAEVLLLIEQAVESTKVHQCQRL